MPAYEALTEAIIAGDRAPALALAKAGRSS
jgi:hypothetical protein